MCAGLKPLKQLCLVALVAGTPGQGLQAVDRVYIDNGQVKLGVDRDRGACIGYFSESSPERNLLNHYDTGRFVQQSYYGDADGSTWAGNPWHHNPVQGAR